METKDQKLHRMLLVMPLLVIPFLALAFYGLGGGKGTSAEYLPLAGINTNLPDAQFRKEDPQDKLSLYSLMAKDSSAFKGQFAELGAVEKAEDPAFPPGLDRDTAEQRINEKLALIQKEINRPAGTISRHEVGALQSAPLSIGKDVDRLEKLMYSMQEGKEEDPEMEQLSAMLDKIIQIRSPQTIAQEAETETKSPADSLFRAIPAKIARRQKVVAGATVELRLLDTLTIGTYVIPAGHALFGTCRITNQRLLLDIRHIRLGTSIIPANLTVYSLDGMPGIDAPEAMLGDAARTGTDNAIRKMGMYGMDQSIATQVAGAGIDAARDLASKKVRKVRVKLSAGTLVLLRNNEAPRGLIRAQS